jgi:hypothetical protein
MKKTLLALALTLSSFTALAEKPEVCTNAILKRCGSLGVETAIRNMYSSCDLIEANGEVQIAFTRGNQLNSIHSADCAVTKVELDGRISSKVEFAGRLFMVTNENELAFLGRDGNVYLFLTSSGTEYKDVAKISVLHRGEALIRKNGNRDYMSEKSIVIEKIKGADVPLAESVVNERIKAKKILKLTHDVRY